jgi:hypothetical protein
LAARPGRRAALDGRPEHEELAMRWLAYAMRFTGLATPASADGTVLRVAATADGSTLTASVGSDGLVGDLRSADGSAATFTAEVTLTGVTSFQEVGTIAFADGHCLRFATVGSGHLGASADPTRKHGAAMCRIGDGEGRFAGASGLITSNFVLGDDGTLTDHHLGVILLT